jgi:type IV pilus assembly protein PilX
MSHSLTSSLSKPVRCGIGSAAGAVSGVRPARVRPSLARGRLSYRASQRGVALVVALVLLVVLTLVGLAAVRGTIMQQKMTSNFTDRQIAFQVGEAGMRQAQIVVQTFSTPILSTALPAKVRDCSPAGGNVCLANPLTDTGLPAADIQPVTVAMFNAGTLAAGQPKYVIEYMGNFKAPTPTVTQLSGCSGYAPCGLSNTADYYRITVSSGPTTAGTDRATVTLQSMFRR